MADTIGRITVPSPVSSGLHWPVSVSSRMVSDFGFSTVRPFPLIEHRFGELATQAVQRFLVGIGPRRFQFRKSRISYQDRIALYGFYESVQGQYQTFLYDVPQSDRVSTVTYTVVFDNAPVSTTELVNACQSGITFIECPDPLTAPTYGITSTCLRFPNSTLQSALLSQVQQIIPLIHIRVRNASVPDIYLSDRRLTAEDTIGGAVKTAMGWGASSQLYLPRLLGIGESGSDVILSQSIDGSSDSVNFTFGNADRTMTALANDCDLKYASVDLCLLHVQSSTILQLWKGFIQDFQSDGSAHFTISCSDGIFQILQMYPTRVYSRTCWKQYNDGVNCPWATISGTVTGSGETTNCDYTYGTDDSGNPISGANGCYQHGMTKYFGGHPLHPQSVLIKDNSTGFLGFGRNTVTATSIVSDTLWGEPMADIWCNNLGVGLNSFVANAIVADVRDESSYEEVLGVLGSGPLGSFTIPTSQSGEIIYNSDGLPVFVGPLADGFYAQGFKLNSNGTAPSQNTSLGLRQWPGSDPYGPGDQSYGEFGLDNIGGTAGVIPFAAGTAFVTLRYAKPAGINPSTTEGHSMAVPIGQGLTGYTWDYTGVRSNTVGLTNPFWIAVNTLIRALGLNGPSIDQTQYFVLSSLVNADGVSGCAQIADAVVTPILGTGTETQFQFQGALAQQKPLRDWLTEILNCGLGFYTWEFGKLKLGCRINATSVSAFTVANMKFQSLILHPINATFERLVMDFADQAYQFQANTAEYQDKDHALYYGRSGAPLTARMHSLGACTISQALRLAITREREETGGINLNNNYNNGTSVDPTQWVNARTCRFETTILSLETEVGQVISITHPDVPTGTGNFRITKWTLKKDWSISIEGKTVTSSMYQYDIGPPGSDVNVPPLPVLLYPETTGQWGPYQVQAPSNDALFPSEWTFDLAQAYTVNADQSATAYLNVTGQLPVNAFLSGCPAPVWHQGSVTISSTGGSLPGGVSLRLELCAYNSSGYSPNSNVLYITIPSGTNTNSITIDGIIWPGFAGLTNYAVFYSQYDDLICYQQSGALTAGTPSTSYTPTSITINGPIARNAWGVPNASIVKQRAKVKYLHHGGVVGAPIDSVLGNLVYASQTVDSMGTDNWAGRVMAIIGRFSSPSIPFESYDITAFDPTTGKFTLSVTPSGLLQYDVFVVCFKGYDNSATPTVFTDAGISNASNGHAGMVTNSEAGYMLRVIAGTSRGKTGNVISNTATSWTIDTPIVIDSTSVWIIEGRNWLDQNDSTPTTTPLPGSSVTIQVPINNLIGQPVVVIALNIAQDGSIGAVNSDGGMQGLATETGEGDAPIRMGYVYGAGGINQRTVTANTSQLPNDGLIRVDTTAGDVTVQLLASAFFVNRKLLVQKISSDANIVKIIPFSGDTINGATELDITTQWECDELFANG